MKHGRETSSQGMIPPGWQRGRGRSRTGSGKGDRGGGGFGKGQGGGRGQNIPRSDRCGGVASTCACPACGTTVAHERGIRCTSIACPQCGRPMTRK